MHVGELTEGEQLVLVALVNLIVHADDRLSTAEAATIRDLAGALGGGVWNARVRDAASRFTTREALLPEIDAVRPEARDLLIDLLDRFASADGVDRHEDAILDWLAARWGVDAPSAFVADRSADDAPSAEDDSPREDEVGDEEIGEAVLEE